MEELTQDGAQLARTMLMASAQLAESMARVQAQRAWMAQSRSTAQAEQAQQQIAAERDAARIIFRPLTDDKYWRDAPQLDRVVQAYMAAASWAEHDPEAHAAAQLIKGHAQTRWGESSAYNSGTTGDSPHAEVQRARRQAAPGVAQPLSGSLGGARHSTSLKLNHPMAKRLRKSRANRQARSAPNDFT